MNEDPISRQDIDLTDGTKHNPLEGMDMHKVMLYLARLRKRAIRGNSEAAREVFWISTKATMDLEEIVDKHPKILVGLPLNDVPVIMGSTGIKDKQDISAKVRKFGAKWNRKMRADANPVLREFIENIVEKLNSTRIGLADDTNEAQPVPILEILTGNGWQAGKHGSVLKGWRDAAPFLPAPTKENATIWWEVAESYLEGEYSTMDSPKWFQNPKIAKVCGPPKKSRIMDTEGAWGAFGKQIRDRFLEAVARLPA